MSVSTIERDSSRSIAERETFPMRQGAGDSVEGSLNPNVGEFTVGVGIPTYNRPELLDRALTCVAAQTYRDLDVLISDNGSPDPRVKEVVHKHMGRDERIRVAWQEQNHGASSNGRYVLDNARTNYFLWLSDDDTWESVYVERLVARMSPETLLAFPDVTLVDAKGGQTPNAMRSVYGHCVSDLDYLRAWCGHGSGYPIYGLYNLPALRAAGLWFEGETDLDYYNEGILLHKLFLNGGVRFVPEAALLYSTASKRPEQVKLVRSYFDYTKRMTLLYLASDKLSGELRTELLGGLLDTHLAYIKSLCDVTPPPRKKTFGARLCNAVRHIGRTGNK